MRPFLLALALVAALGGCETVVAPTDPGETYTVWGALDPTQDVQFVRVVPVTATIGDAPPGLLPLRVSTFDFRTGEETPWRDSLVTFRDGSVGNVFTARFRPAFGNFYRLRLIRESDGGELSAVTSVPDSSAPARWRPPDEPRRVAVIWPGALRLNAVRVRVLAQSVRCDTASVELPLGPGVGTTALGFEGTAVRLTFEEVVRDLRAALRLPSPDEPVGVRRVSIRVEVADLNWTPPGGGNVFDLETLASPGAFSNVEGGFGLFLAAYRSAFSFEPAPGEVSGPGLVDTSAMCGSL